MPTTRQILKRRRSVQNIRKITRTMEMIATVRFRRVQGRTTSRQAYTDQLTRLAYTASQAINARDVHPLQQRHEDPAREALVVLSSNRGLCGGYNANVQRLARRRIDEWRQQGREVDVYAVGKKAQAGLRFHDVPVHAARPQFEGLVDSDAVRELAEELMARFTGRQVASVTVAYTQFLSAGAQRPVLLKLLPLERPEFGLLETAAAKEQLIRMARPAQYDFQPGAEAVLDRLLPDVVRWRLYQCFLDAVAGEQLARMTAMRLASESAEEMIRDLTARYNRARQGLITTELAEIISGAEALE